jgi:hypothetical protein
MTKLSHWLALFVLSATIIQCSRCKENVEPNDGLPPETQTGARTFGCKINGVNWVASGGNFLTLKPATSANYDPTYEGGTLSITAADYLGRDPATGIADYFVFGASQLTKPQIYQLPDRARKAGIDVHLSKKGCEYMYSPNQDNPIIRGTLNIKKLDTMTRIVAGTFDFVTQTKGCDTLKITEGRFDVRF